MMKHKHLRSPVAASVAISAPSGTLDHTVEGVLAYQKSLIDIMAADIATLQSQIAALQANDATQDSHIGSINALVVAY